MDALPQIQSTISSRKVSSKEARGILQDFLATQKKYFLEHEMDISAIENEDVEEYYNMGDQVDKLGYGEFEQRIGGMVESLADDYFSKKPEDKESASILRKHDKPDEESSIVENTSVQEVAGKEAVGNDEISQITVKVEDQTTDTQPAINPKETEDKDEARKEKNS